MRRLMRLMKKLNAFMLKNSSINAQKIESNKDQKLEK